jgi:hypothetical protein
MNHLYFGIVSLTQKNVDPVPVLTSIEDSVKRTISVGYSDVEMLHCCQGGADEKHVMYSSLQVREERLPYSFDPFGCLDLQDD